MRRRQVLAGLTLLSAAGCLDVSDNAAESTESESDDSTGNESGRATESPEPLYDCDDARKERYRRPRTPFEELGDDMVLYYVDHYENVYVGAEAPEDSSGASLTPTGSSEVERTADRGVLAEYEYTYSYKEGEGDETTHGHSGSRVVRYFLSDEVVLRADGRSSDPREEGTLLTCFD